MVSAGYSVYSSQIAVHSTSISNSQGQEPTVTNVRAGGCLGKNLRYSSLMESKYPEFDLVKGGSSCFQGVPHVLQRFAGLPSDIARYQLSSLGIKRRKSGNENEPVRLDCGREGDLSLLQGFRHTGHIYTFFFRFGHYVFLRSCIWCDRNSRAEH